MLWLLAAAALAGPFVHKSMHGDWPERQVERGVVLPKGWIETAIAADSKRTRFYRDDWGARTPWDGATWSYSQLWLEVRQGFSRRTTLYLRVPWVASRLQNALGADIATRNVGDVRVGIQMEPMLARLGSRQHAALRLEVKAPSGSEWPANNLGGPSHVNGFLTGTGITNIGLYGTLRKTLWRWALISVESGYTLKPPAVVGYVVDSENYANGWLDPGDELWVDLDLGAQLDDDWALTMGPELSQRGTYRMGISGPSAFRTILEPIPGGDGSWVDWDFALSFEPHERVEVGANASWNLAGGDTTTFAGLGLEEFSPQPGWTWGARAAVRW